MMLRQGIDRICLLLWLVVISMSLYRYLTSSDAYKCGALLTGEWTDPPAQWQPPGCLLHEYDSRDMTTCLQGKLAFVGDSTVREVFWAMAEKLDASGTGRAIHAADKHSDITFNMEGVELDFVWDPYLNSSKLDHILESQRSHAAKEDKALVLLIGGGLWHARNLGDVSTKAFGSAFDRMVVNLRKPEGSMLPFVNPHNSRPNVENLLAIAPVRVPQYRSLSPDRAATLAQNKINPMNDYLQHLSKDHGLPVVWSYSAMTWEEPLAFQKDGLHVVHSVATLQADILLNLRCNAKLSSRGSYPMDKTCCSAYTQPNWIQRTFLMCSLGLLPLFTAIAAKESRRRTFLPSRKVSYALTVIALASGYCYYADRTQIFNKLHKRYSSAEFRVMCLGTLVLGILSIRQSVQTVVVQGQRSATKKIDQLFLSRDQTDEWKGWMQFLILIYHYTGASRVLGIYRVIRILVASYLFMTGFGHTAYFYRKGDYSLRRCAAVLLRINFLSCVLPYVMRTDYLFYYFAPLTSFWYVIVYLTMQVGHAHNQSTKFLIGKIVVSALLVTGLIRAPGVLEAIFLLLERSARIHWNVTEWRFRVHLDNYIVYVGMLSAIAFIKISDGLQSDTDGAATVVRVFNRLRTVALVAACVTLPAYWVAVASITEKSEYNSWVPYLSCLSILSFVVLRNCSRHLRNFYSSIFAWLGRHSLETFTLQFHIWLAADTKGILSLGFEPWQEFVPITIIFLWVSWQVASATNVITSWLVDPKADRRDVEIEDSMSDMELPRTKSRDSMSSYGQIDKALTVSANGICRVLREKLTVRLALILTVLWLLNLAY